MGMSIGGQPVKTISIGGVPVTTIRAGSQVVWQAVTGHVLEVVAHQDDDLFFMTPDIITDLQDAKAHTVLYLTAGDAGDGAAYWQAREVGVQAAYSTLTGQSGSWTLGTETYAGYTVHTATLGRVKHIYLRLPESSGASGSAAYGYQTLEKLWTQAITSMTDVQGVNVFTKRQLLGLIKAVAVAVQPQTARTLDSAQLYTDTSDNHDHITAGRFAVSALAGVVPEIVCYQGYGVTTNPVNVTGALYDQSLAALQAYQPHDSKMASINTDWVARCYTAVPDAPTAPLPGTGGGVLGASVLVSSQAAADTQTGDKALDGTIDGYPGDYHYEWASLDEAGDAWIELRWPTPTLVSTITLHSRFGGWAGQSGTILFSDGSTVTVPNLDTDTTTVAFTARTVTSARFTWDTAPGTSVGLREIQAT